MSLLSGAKAIKDLNDAVVRFHATISSVNERLGNVEARVHAERNRADSELKEVRADVGQNQTRLQVAESSLARVEGEHRDLVRKYEGLKDSVTRLEAQFEAAVTDGVNRKFDEWLKVARGVEPVLVGGVAPKALGS